MNTQHQAPANAWHLQVGRDICSDVQAALDTEWLVTNGLGGYAAGAISGATTRCYHGLLVAALHPPVERVVLVTKLDEEVTLPAGQTLKLGTNEYLGGTIDPQGYNYLVSVSLEEGDIPCFVYRLSDTLTLEKRIWMEYSQNTTYVQYALHGTLDREGSVDDGSATSLTLTLSPFCLSRDYHGTTQGSPNWHFLVEDQRHRCTIRAYEGAPSYQLVADPSVSFSPRGFWYWRVWHRRDSERGLPDYEDVYLPGVFRMNIAPGMHKTLVLSAEPRIPATFGSLQHEQAVALAYTRHQRRVKQLLAVADRSTDSLQTSDPVYARLVVAADQFIVARPDYSKTTKNEPSLSARPLRLAPDRKTVIAGYPWFTDWGRDSMISLPGLLLSTGRYSEARGLFKAFTAFVRNGLIPNRFPDNRDAPEYNTADATLWMFHALDRYLSATGDWTLLKELFPVLTDIIEWHVRGTDYGVGVDVQDGLLHAGAPGVQLTWMDAKVDDWVVTPRRGKPVEVNALWYYALTAMENWAVRLSTDATQYSQLRTQVRQHFAARFWYEQGGYLYDVVDVDGVAGHNDASLRPNQLFAASLTHDLLSEEQIASIFQQVTDHLLTPVGLRSLSPTDPAYCKHFNGDRWHRDSAYHQGTVWQWLIGPYIDVHLRIHNDRAALQPLLQPLVQHLWTACLGTISEIAEPEPPFTPAGCFAQAWSVAELLRCWLLATG
ncbi:MAG TPA: amylo-alpha-1,6-glucosidase [Ktedonobacteraceae bacterium]|nr:amylo-alpha-1,6-glucosidase [Ktedonobacteraceae bacterium]